MARLVRAAVLGVPRYVTQRGNRRQQIFFADDDNRRYRGLIVATFARADRRPAAARRLALWRGVSSAVCVVFYFLFFLIVSHLLSPQ